MGTVDRAYALLQVKSFDAARRTFTGIATTPTPDRSGDIVDPLGVTFRNPLPLLLHHDKTKPVGSVVFDAPTAAGITFTASIPEVAEAGALKDRLDEAMQSVGAKLFGGVSIGYRILRDGAARIANSAGLLLKRIEVCELSLVTVPSNSEATILSIKALDAPHLAASGLPPSGVSDLPVVSLKGSTLMPKTIAERITDLDTARTVKVDRISELLRKSAEADETLSGDDAAEHDRLALEVKALDAEITRNKNLEALQVKTATPLVPSTSTKDADLRGGHQVQVKSRLEPGTGFTRYMMALLANKGSRADAVQWAEERGWKDSSPEVILALKAAVAPGTTTDATWAKPLVPQVQSLAAEFIALLRPATLLGKIPNLRKVPFNVSVPMQTGGGSYNWVGEAKPKWVTQLAFGTASLAQSKIAGIIVLTEELVRSSSPDAESVCRADMIAGIAQFMDQQFVDPAVADAPGVHPASITNGVTGIPSTGNPATDFAALLAPFVNSYIPLNGITILMSEATAFQMGLLLNAVGQPAFPDISASGGKVNGISVVTSGVLGTNMIALCAPYILYADDGGVTIDLSREASVQMNTSPDDPPTAATVLVSLWQNNLIGLRAERFVTWKKARPDAVTLLTGATYVPEGTITTPPAVRVGNGERTIGGPKHSA